MIRYTPQHLEFLRDGYRRMTLRSLTKALNNRFGLSKTESQIKQTMQRNGIRSGRTGCFEKGHAPWNAGTKGQGLTGANPGSFKKGSVPANVKPVGFERICKKDGFISIKINEANPYTGFSTRFKHKQVYVWEQEHGPVPKGMVVAFKDSDKTNCDPGNLMLISRAELLWLNRNGYKDTPDELKPSLLALAKLKVRTFEKDREQG